MTGTIRVYCPYCGAPNTDEYSLMNLHNAGVWFLECHECRKESTIILYDSSEQKEKEVG